MDSENISRDYIHDENVWSLVRNVDKAENVWEENRFV